MLSWFRPGIGGGAAGAATTVAPEPKKNIYSNLRKIIERTSAAPTIINDSSRFVVVTYWWGRGNMNKNVARPCLDFYEQLVLEPFKVLNNQIYLEYHDLAHNKINWLKWFVSESSGLKQFYQKMVTKYLHEKGVLSPGQPGYDEASYNKQWGHYLRSILDIVVRAFQGADPLIREILRANADWEIAKEAQNAGNLSIEMLKEMKRAVEEKIKLVMVEIKTSMRKYIFGAGAGKPHVPNLEELLMFRPPLTYDKMIDNWKTKCADSGCNYLEVEYPEFAKPGGCCQLLFAPDGTHDQWR